MKKFLFCLFLTFSLGCSGSDAEKPKTVEVSGKVTLNGQPLKNAEVHFMTDASDSVGVTDSEGNYSLVQGAIPGKNRVYISTVDRSKQPTEGDAEEGMDAGQLAAQNPDDPAGTKVGKNAEKLPPKYSDPDKTILTFQVPEEGTSSANFNLK
ncbi:MAG: hypothetical protein Tsb009_32480 [Planctomycetaceae bacterium]